LVESWSASFKVIEMAKPNAATSSVARDIVAEQGWGRGRYPAACAKFGGASAFLTQQVPGSCARIWNLAA
jgi:hypothetical protein